MKQEQDPLEELKKLKKQQPPARQPLIRNSKPAESGPGYGERLATTVLSAAQVLPGMKALEAGAGALGSRAYHLIDRDAPVLSYRDAYHALDDNMQGMGTGRVLASQLAAAPMLTPVMATRLMQGAGLAGSGAILGGASAGLEGDPDATATDVAQRTAIGAGVGAVAGYAAPKLIRAAGRPASKVATALGLRPTGRTAQEMAADASTMKTPRGPEAPIAKAMGNRTPASGASSKPSPALRARAAVGRQVGKVIEPSKTRALRQVAERFSADNVSPENAIAFAERNAGKPIAVLDLGEGNVGGLARTAKDTPGLGRRIIPQFLEERSAGVRGDEGRTLQRVTEDIEKRIGLRPENYFQTMDDMLAEQKTLSKPAYDKVRDLVVDDGEVLSLFDIPEFKFAHDAVASAERIRPGGMKIKPMTQVDELGGSVHLEQNPQTLGTLDKMRQYIGDLARGKLEDKRIDRHKAGAMLERLDAATQRLDELYPDYAAARAGYSGRAKMMDAYELGKTEFLRQDPRQLAATIAKLPAGEADVFRRGGYDALRAGKLTKMEDGANIGAFLEKNPDIRDRVAALAKNPADAELLRNDLGIEKHMGSRKALITSGPNTAERLIDHAHSSAKAQPTAAGGLVRSLPVVGKVAGAAIDSRIARRFTEETSDVMGEVAKIMTRSGVDGIRLTAEEVKDLLGADLAREFARAGKYGSVAGGTASSLPRRQR